MVFLDPFVTFHALCVQSNNNENRISIFSVGRKNLLFANLDQKISISMCVTSVLANKTIITLNHSHVVMCQVLQ